MEFRELLRRRRMIRSFDGRAVDPEGIAALCELALLAPTAGNSAGTAFVVVDAAEVAEYFNVATDEAWRVSATRAPGLLRAGAVVLAFCDPTAYTARYQAPDKRASGLGVESSWDVPYWFTDAAMATVQLLLLLEEEDLAATLWGNFRHEDEVARWANVPPQWRLYGSVLVGYADGNDRRSASLEREVTPRRDRVLRRTRPVE